MPGLRLGWIATQDTALLQSIRERKDFTTLAHHTLSDTLGSLMLPHLETLTQNRLQLIQQNWQSLNELLTEYRDYFDWQCPQAGASMLVSMNTPLLKRFNHATHYADWLRTCYGVMILPSKVYHLRDTAFRLGWGGSQFNAAMDCLTRAFKSLKG
jgi:aspartate/methionine/tyrosine aminotransferase